MKTSSWALFISFTEKEIFQVFYPAYAKKKKNLSSDTYCKARSAKLPNYTFMNEEKAGMHQLSCIK